MKAKNLQVIKHKDVFFFYLFFIFFYLFIYFKHNYLQLLTNTYNYLLHEKKREIKIKVEVCMALLYMWIKKRFLLCRNVRGKGKSFLFWEKDCAFYISK